VCVYERRWGCYLSYGDGVVADDAHARMALSALCWVLSDLYYYGDGSSGCGCGGVYGGLELEFGGAARRLEFGLECIAW